MAVAEDSWY